MSKQWETLISHLLIEYPKITRPNLGLEKMFNFLLSRFQKYRSWRGGIWWLVVEVHGKKRWVNKFPKSNLVVQRREDYSKEQYQALTCQEFYQAIANIPRNGEWQLQLNLTKYLWTARLLRGAGIEDELIIRTLTDLYKASDIEQTAHLPLKIYSIDEIMEIVNRDK